MSRDNEVLAALLEFCRTHQVALQAGANDKVVVFDMREESGGEALATFAYFSPEEQLAVESCL